MKISKKFIIIIAVILVATIVLFLFKDNGNITTYAVKDSEITVYKSQSCGCCTGFTSFLKSKGFQVEVVTLEDTSALKDKYNIPEDMRSCHTSIIGGYFIEGHMPIEAVNKLLEEKPDIDGIALPDMPSGSPGMPGSKIEDWKIYSIKDGISSEFIVI